MPENPTTYSRSTVATALFSGSLSDEDQVVIANSLAEVLGAIPAGTEDATKYQNLMMGVLEFLFYPSLICPRKEHEINDGRKRIDIVFENDSTDGPFRWILDGLKLPAPYIVFECKNYSNDLKNPELDQLLGRFSPGRGRVGFVCCRTLDDYDLFLKRCQDSYKDAHGLVVPLEDEFILRLLAHVANHNRENVANELQARINSVCSV